MRFIEVEYKIRGERHGKLADRIVESKDIYDEPYYTVEADGEWFNIPQYAVTRIYYRISADQVG